MKKLITGIFICGIILTGCIGAKYMGTKINSINTVSAVTYESPYEMIQDNTIMLSDLEKELQDRGIGLEARNRYNKYTSEYYLEYEGTVINIVCYDITDKKENEVITDIHMNWDDKVELNNHPVVESIANLIGKEKVLTWIKEKEEKWDKIAQENSKEESYMDSFAEFLNIERCFIHLMGWNSNRGYNRNLEFTWAFVPYVGKEFEGIAGDLERSGLLVTGYIEGAGGNQINAMSPEYNFLEENGYNNDRVDEIDITKSVAYKVMYDKNKKDSYSVQLYGHMREDLSYVTKVEEMAGLDAISRAMNMDGKDFIKLTNQINKELTKARELLNPNLQRDYYIEGEMGEYNYIIAVPSGLRAYRFTVLIEKNN